MNVSLTDQLEEFIAQEVESGRYRSASEVVRAGVRLLQDQTRLNQLRVEALRRDLGQGLTQLDRGESVSATEAFAEILENLAERDP